MLKQSPTEKTLRRLEKIVDFVTHEDFLKLLGKLSRLFHSNTPVLTTESEVTYEQAIKYFVEQNPDPNTTAKAVLKREREPDKFKLTWLFLDQNDKPVCRTDGAVCMRQTYALRIDKELEESFDGRDIIVFE